MTKTRGRSPEEEEEEEEEEKKESEFWRSPQGFLAIENWR